MDATQRARERGVCKYFSDVLLDPPEAPTQLLLKRADNPAPLDPEAQRFFIDVELAQTRLRRSFSNLDVLRALLEHLYAAAQTGLVCQHPSLTEGRSRFTRFELEVTTMAESIRAHYLRRTLLVSGIAALVGVVLVVLGFAMLDSLSRFLATRLDYEARIRVINSAGAGAFALIGIGVGNIFIAYITGRHITYANFDVLNQYRYTPVQQLFLIIVICIVFMIILALNVIQIGIGGLLLNDFVMAAPVGIVAGLVCAISEPVVVRLLRRATQPSVREEALENVVATGTNVTTSR